MSALGAAGAIPGKFFGNIWKQRATIPKKGIAKTVKIAKQFRPANTVKDGAIRGAIGGGVSTALKDAWNSTKLKEDSKKQIDKLSTALDKGSRKISKSIDKHKKRAEERKKALFNLVFEEALFAKQESDIKKAKDKVEAIVKPKPTSPASDVYLSWKAKRKLLTEGLKRHGQLQKAGASKKLERVRRGLDSAAKNYGSIADVATKRLSQLGTVASVTGRKNLAKLSNSAKDAINNSRDSITQKLKNSESKVEQSKRAFDTVTAAKNAAKVAAVGVPVGIAGVVASKTPMGKKFLKDMALRRVAKQAVKNRKKPR